jgi:hypothetical protein
MRQSSRALRRPFLPALFLLPVLGGCLREFDNPSDPGARRYTGRSEAFLRLLGDAEPVEGDTVRFVGGVTSAGVAEDSLVERFDWDLDGDGRTDTSMTGTDTLAVRFESSGRRTVGLALKDRAGFTSAARVDIQVHPRLSTVFRWSGYDSACPVYAQEPDLMRIVLAVSHFTQERNREEGFGTAGFAFKIAQTLVGTAFPLELMHGFDFSYSRGVYRFKGTGITLEAAFHYGPGLPGRAEGDTIRHNLFALDSYVTGIRTTLAPPSVRYDRGPLADLIDGDITADLDDIDNPGFDFRVDFNRLRVSFSRVASLPYVLGNEGFTRINGGLFLWLDSRARIAPLHPPDLVRLYGKDSLELDFSGTRVSSPEIPISWAYEKDGVRDTAVYRLSLVQETLRQSFRFGEAGGEKKVFGDYAAVNRLGTADLHEAVYFQGRYSSADADSARFRCKEPMEEGDVFGVAAFETETPGRGRFESERFGYSFGFPFSIAEPWIADGTEP